ncbi:hypothetical protein ACKWTF_006742 [Chironomus riparius]
MIPGGQPYSAFEKLFQPFQLILWCSLLLTFAIGLVTITIINCQNEKIRNFVFGSKINTPYLNLYNILVNGFQDVLPQRTFARYVLMIFMIFCLVLRTTYQGSLYQFLQSDGTKPNMETIDELMRHHYLFYIRETLEHNIKSMSFYNRRKVVKFSEYPELIKKTLDPNFKGGIIMPLLEVILPNQENYKNFIFRVLKEYLFDVQIVYYYPKNFHLVDVLDEKLELLKSAGIVSMWMDHYVDKKYVNIKTPSTGPRIINVNQLLGSFEVWMIGMIISIVLFVIEVVSSHKSMKLLRNVLNKI